MKKAPVDRSFFFFFFATPRFNHARQERMIAQLNISSLSLSPFDYHPRVHKTIEQTE